MNDSYSCENFQLKERVKLLEKELHEKNEKMSSILEKED
jgi:hypothetical protein